MTKRLNRFHYNEDNLKDKREIFKIDLENNFLFKIKKYNANLEIV